MNYKLNIIDELIPIKRAHQMTDALIEEEGIAKDKPCRKGCAYCCNQEIVVSIPEAMLVVSNLVRTQEGKVWLANNFKKIREHVALVQKIYVQNPVKCLADMDRNHEAWLNTRTPCVFLEGGICKVYETRPIVCRSYFVVEDSSLCEKTIPGKTMTVVQIPLAIGAAFASSEKVAKTLRIPSDPMPFPIAVNWALVGYIYGPGGIRHQMKTAEKLCEIVKGKYFE